MAAEIAQVSYRDSRDERASMRPRRMAAEIVLRHAVGRRRQRASMRPRRMAAEIVSVGFRYPLRAASLQ